MNSERGRSSLGLTRATQACADRYTSHRTSSASEGVCSYLGMCEVSACAVVALMEASATRLTISALVGCRIMVGGRGRRCCGARGRLLRLVVPRAAAQAARGRGGGAMSRCGRADACEHHAAGERRLAESRTRTRTAERRPGAANCWVGGHPWPPAWPCVAPYPRSPLRTLIETAEGGERWTDTE
jgi:hypothetical protein